MANNRFMSLLLILSLTASACFAGDEELEALSKKVVRDFEYINHNLTNWFRYIKAPPKVETYEVVIIGGGMSALSVAGTLVKHNFHNIKIFDENPAGMEGPWATYARMNVLRSGKELPGPALDVPSLSFRSWFEAKYGQEEWETFYYPSQENWMEYLKWYKNTLCLPVQNNSRLVSMTYMDGRFLLEFDYLDEIIIVAAQRVVLATGRKGFGAANIPSFVDGLPKKYYAHSSEVIDFTPLQGKKVAVIGCGASAFDAASTSLDRGAESVDLLIRRSNLPRRNEFAKFSHQKYMYAYAHRSDEWRWSCMVNAFKIGTPPPGNAKTRLQQWKNKCRTKFDTAVLSTREHDGRVAVETSRGTEYYDYLILATGFGVNGRLRPELSEMIDHIALWEDRLPPELIDQNPALGRFPYLSKSFQFTEKTPGEAPYLKFLYCFNYGAALSQGLLSSEIPGLNIGAQRLVEGIITSTFQGDRADVNSAAAEEPNEDGAAEDS